jgi:hypothetical protein
MLTPEEIRASADFQVPVMFAPGDATTVETNQGQGLGNGATGCSRGMGWIGLVGVVTALLL